MSNETNLSHNEEMAYLGEKPVWKLLWQFFAPAMVGMVAHTLYNLVDKIYVGQGVGQIGLGALTVVFPIMMVGFGVTLLYGGGGAALISLRMGEGKKKAAETFLSTSVGMSFATGLVVMALGLIFDDELLRLFGANDELMASAKSYLFWILLGFPMLSCGFVMNFTIRAEGRPRTSVLIALISTIFNIILDPILIFGFDMGVAGAALATAISQALTFILSIAYYLSGRSVLQIHAKYLFAKLSVMRSIFVLGLPACIADMLFGAQQLFVNLKLVEHGGTVAVAAMGVVFGVMALAVMPVFAVADGLQPIVGFNFGAKLYGRVKETLVMTSILVVLLSAIVISPTFIWPKLFVSMFNNGDDTLLAVASRGLQIYCWGVPMFGFCFVMTRYYQAIGRGGKAIVISTLKPFVLFVPPLYILAAIWGLDGVWASEPASGLLSGIVVGLILIAELRVVREEHEVAVERVGV
ncbi:MATE family efflux transporter [Planctomycetota bacterium]|nr:MATE family efflux transporter [Planctomycetota bacterium]